MEDNATKRIRKPNFSHLEIERLVSCVEERPYLNNIELGKVFKTTHEVRNAWEEVAKEVNSCSFIGLVRSGREVRDKWQDLKCRIKKKALNIHKLARNSEEKYPIPELLPIDKRILKFINCNNNIEVECTVETTQEEPYEGILESTDNAIEVNSTIVYCQDSENTLLTETPFYHVNKQIEAYTTSRDKRIKRKYQHRWEVLEEKLEKLLTTNDDIKCSLKGINESLKKLVEIQEKRLEFEMNTKIK
ncbi:uncharacterized protein [Centruroides vittatus]|uniref:uncharacterized protein isoform X1 n=1 Tax=Centruroides vittatus TaxID=120091 RepID=UPI00350EC784